MGTPLNAHHKMKIKALNDRITELKTDLATARKQIKGALQVMGPAKPKCCQGCEWEWNEALKILKGETDE